MSLENIKGSYDAIFSLGDLCLTSIQLEKNNLRPFSGPLDWMASPSLKDVSRLLQNRFSGFMELPNLAVRGYGAVDNFLVIDEAYNIVSNHDFATDKNTLSHLATYPEVKEKFNRRIRRFLEKMNTSQRVLFIRTEGTFEEILELELILSGIVKNDFRILLVNHSSVNGIIEKNWPLKRVCAIELPNDNIWNNDRYWKMILSEVSLNI
ncbi:DUF1796 family putative cysteine peptidase [Priestia megaterium]|uniref:DUF1796 family putative cysteine peptidase n=1 Tax=Priestia megaterium TaxID=1404 RepID=UPI00203DA411|nr:DUF1796 family putative cysteine peptidase [Priestia megaterium]MCM3197151.1 papain-like cysteine peptidase [Priestia megaterium]